MLETKNRKRYGIPTEKYITDRYSRHFTKGKRYEVVGRNVITDSGLDIYATDREGNWLCEYMDEFIPKNTIGGVIL